GRVRRRLPDAPDAGRAGARGRRGGREHAAEVHVLLPEAADRVAVQPAELIGPRFGMEAAPLRGSMEKTSNGDYRKGHSMKATARRSEGSFKHSVQVRDHSVVVDEALETGGDDSGPDPQEILAVSLASCTAI